LRGQVQVKRRRRFAAGHAQRWLRRDDPERSHERAAWWRALKEFKAVCLRGKQLAVRVYSRAAANNAKRLLQASRGDLPYPPRSIQFDGGSEFRAGFEDACQTLGLPLSVLPPKSPQLNGVAECANGSSRTEFWSLCAGELIIKEAAPATMSDPAARWTCPPQWNAFANTGWPSTPSSICAEPAHSIDNSTLIC